LRWHAIDAGLADQVAAEHRAGHQGLRVVDAEQQEQAIHGLIERGAEKGEPIPEVPRGWRLRRRPPGRSRRRRATSHARVSCGSAARTRRPVCSPADGAQERVTNVCGRHAQRGAPRGQLRNRGADTAHPGGRAGEAPQTSRSPKAPTAGRSRPKRQRPARSLNQGVGLTGSGWSGRPEERATQTRATPNPSEEDPERVQDRRERRGRSHGR
jgi:hypothetical protein